jgi:hypothetical protein
MTVLDAAIWIRTHWFELAALALQLVNIWFVFAILNALKVMTEALVLLGDRSDRNGDASIREGPSAETGRGGLSTPILGSPHPVLINITLAALSWALLLLIIVALWVIL